MTPPILCSSGAYTWFNNATDHQSILTYGPFIAADGVEIMFHRSFYANLARIASDLQQSGLPFPALHIDKKVGRGLGNADPMVRASAIQQFERNCWLASQLQVRHLILHLWERPESDGNLAVNLQMLPQLLDITEAYGLELAIETIPCDRSDPISNVLRAIECDPRCKVALDTEFLAMAGQIETVFSWQQFWEERVCHVHVKDWSTTGQRYLQPGQGEIDFVSFFARLQALHFTGDISLESAACDGEHVDLAILNESIQCLRRTWVQAERFVMSSV